jgi:hypothetical protein
VSDVTHAKFIEKLGDAHEKRIVEALASLEERIIALMTGAPLKDGQLFDLEWAIAARKDILQAITEEYLVPVNSDIAEYVKAAESAVKMIQTYTDFVGISPAVVSALQSQAFLGFENIGTTFLNDISSEIYQNTLAGRPISESIKTIRQKINGVYAQADQVEIQRLVDIANGGGKGAEEAIKELKSVYAADKVGNNMRRYSTQMVHDSLMQFDASIVVQAGKETGADQWKYYGSVIRDSRPFCKEHAGKVYTEEEIRDIWKADWAGKAPGDPFIVRGGYNCRHHFRPFYSENE